MVKKIYLFVITNLLLAATVFSQPSSVLADRGGRLTIGYVNQGDFLLNPLQNRFEYEAEILTLLFGEGLFTIAPEGHVIHGIAASSDAQNPLTWRFNLRNDVYFHDGKKLTAQDVKFTFELYKKFALQATHLFKTRLINSVEIINSQSFRITLKKPVTDFSETIGQLPVLSEQVYNAWLNYNLISSLPNIRPVGTGYFKFNGQSASGILYLNAYEEHYRGRPNLSGINIRLFDFYDEMLDAFLRENTDLIQVQDKSVLQKIYQFMPSREHIVNMEKDLRSLYYINFNNKREPFNDINIRKAINYSIDRAQLVSKLLEDRGEISYSLFREKSPYYFEAGEIYEYNPLQSIEILTAAGYRKNFNGKLLKDNEELKFELYFEQGSPFEESIVRMVSINLAELGINVVPRPLKATQLREVIREGNYQAVLDHYRYNETEPAQAVREFYINFLNSEDGFSNFKSRTIDRVLRFSENPLDERQTNEITQRTQYILNQYSPCVFMFLVNRSYFAVNTRFENFKNSYYKNLEFIVKLNPKYEWFVPVDKQKNK